MNLLDARVTLYDMEDFTPHSHPRPVRACEVCGLAVGTYEPAVFVFGSEVIHSSRAAEPGLAGKAGCRLMHKDCFTEHGVGPHLRLVES